MYSIGHGSCSDGNTEYGINKERIDAATDVAAYQSRESFCSLASTARAVCQWIPQTRDKKKEAEEESLEGG